MIRVLFMGRKPVAAKSLEYLVSLKGVQVVGVLTDSHLSVSPTTDVARQFGLPLYEFTEALAVMKSGDLLFDLGVSVLYWRKLRDEFLSLPTRGIINLHPAPLPNYKGTAGYNIAILDELKQWAVTAHYVDENIDTGRIIEVSYFDISPTEETAQSLERKTQPFLLSLFTKTINRALSTESHLPTSPNTGGRYISRDEMESMKKVLPDDDVSRKIRAFWFPPYDGAYILVNNVKCTLVDNFILQQLADPKNSSLFSKKAK